MVSNAVCNVIESKVFVVNLRNELSRYSYPQLEEERDEFSVVKTILYMKDMQGMETQRSFMGNIMQQFLLRLPNSSLDLLGMLQHYWEPKFPTVCWHIMSRNNTLLKAVTP